MVKHVLSFALANLMGAVAFGQFTGPWQRPLVICNSTDGLNYTNVRVFQDSSGVPSLAKDNSGRLIAVFQWFPAPLHGPHWDSVAIKYSYDEGDTWTYPQTTHIDSFPAGFQRIFDPSISINPDGTFRLYFSSGTTGPGATVSTYSAHSPDGTHFTFDTGVRVTRAGTNTIDPTVIYFNGAYHYAAPKGAPGDGSLHAVSPDGLNFSMVPDIPSDPSHNWTGNFMVDSLALKFYGTPAAGISKIWFKDSPNGGTWNPAYMNCTEEGGDPSCVKVRNGKYLMVYTGPPYPTPMAVIDEQESPILYPNPVSGLLNISLQTPGTLTLYTIDGRLIASCNHSLKTQVIDCTGYPNGVYYLHVGNTDKHSVHKVIVRH